LPKEAEADTVAGVDMQAAAVDALLAVADGLSVEDTGAARSVADTAVESVVATATAVIVAAMDTVMAAASAMGTA
jgi:hypothetical protein